MMRELIPGPIKAILKRIRERYFTDFSARSYSQEGEDLILQRFFADQPSGFYVDVGAHHPERFSNTYRFYRQGWRGINIDAMPGSMRAFRRKRPRDINVEVPVSEHPGALTYYIFNEPALNGFSRSISEGRDGLGNFRIIRTQEIHTRTLASILDEFMPAGQVIDFLTVDVEGLDFEVLKSNNWSKYKPRFVLVEILGSSLEASLGSDVATFLFDKGYVMVAKSYNTAFFALATS